MAENRKQLTVWVSESQKENWDEYQQELGFSSRGEMVRRAVEYYHAAETGDEGGDASEKVLSRLDEIEDRVERVKLDIADVREEQVSEDLMDTLIHNLISNLMQETVDIPEEWVEEPFEDIDDDIDDWANQD